MLARIEYQYSRLSDTIVRVSTNGAKRDLVKEAMRQYAAQEVAEKDVMLEEAARLLNRWFNNYEGEGTLDQDIKDFVKKVNASGSDTGK